MHESKGALLSYKHECCVLLLLHEVMGQQKCPFTTKMSENTRTPGKLLNYQVGKYIVLLEMEISHRKMQ